VYVSRVKRLAFVFIAIAAACGGGGKKSAVSAGPGSDSAAIYAKKMVMSWGIQQHDGSADVFLQTTDETGKQTSYPLGTYQGQCKVITPVAELKAVSAVACNQVATGVELDATTTDEEIIILEGNTQNGNPPDAMSREEVLRVKAPGGAKVESGT
jgi:hypothetical protein